MEDIIRVLKVLEYRGPRRQVEKALERSIQGSKSVGKMTITSCALNPVSAEVISIKTPEKDNI